jgi:hypothetical protein
MRRNGTERVLKEWYIASLLAGYVEKQKEVALSQFSCISYANNKLTT